jgi:hypothetical protein
VYGKQFLAALLNHNLFLMFPFGVIRAQDTEQVVIIGPETKSVCKSRKFLRRPVFSMMGKAFFD